MSPRWRFCGVSSFCVLQTCRALVLNAPSSPVIFGSVVVLTWSFTLGDPTSFNLESVCTGLPPLPLGQINTADGQAPVSTNVVQLPPELNFDISLPCVLRARNVVDSAILALSAPFSVIVQATAPSGPPVSVPPPPGLPLPTPTSIFPPTDTVISSTNPPLPPSITSSSTPIRQASTTAPFNTEVSATPSSTLGSVRTLSSVLLATNPGTTLSTSITSSGSSTSSDAATPLSEPTTTAPAEVADNNKPVAAIVGGSIGGLVAVAAIVVLLVLWSRRRKGSRGLDLFGNEKLNNSAEDEEWLGPAPQIVDSLSPRESMGYLTTESHKPYSLKPDPFPYSNYSSSYAHQDSNPVYGDMKYGYQGTTVGAGPPNDAYGRPWDVNGHPYSGHSPSTSALLRRG